jgi:hypothetical protein
VLLLPRPWRGAALGRARGSRDILFSATKAKYGVKRAAPGNYRTRGFVPSCHSGILDPLNAPIDLITRRNVHGSRLFKEICGQARDETKHRGMLGARAKPAPLQTLGNNTAQELATVSRTACPTQPPGVSDDGAKSGRRGRVRLGIHPDRSLIQPHLLIPALHDI